jgi:DNA-binding response OmpR family regulator
MKKILIAEDEIFLYKVMANKLKKEGFEVTVATDGEEAIRIIQAEKPNLVLLDLLMPKRDGFEVLETMHADESLKKIPVIIASNLGQESDVERGKKLGAVEYIVKADLSIHDIVKKVKEHVGESEPAPDDADADADTVEAITKAEEKPAASAPADDAAAKSDTPEKGDT